MGYIIKLGYSVISVGYIIRVGYKISVGYLISVGYSNLFRLQIIPIYDQRFRSYILLILLPELVFFQRWIHSAPRLLPVPVALVPVLAVTHTP